VASISQVTQGTHTPSGLDTEETLTTQTDAEVYILVVNLTNMASGDTTILRIKPKVLTGGAAALAFSQSFTGAQTEVVVYSEPIASAHSVAFTLEQTDGTARAYEWAVVKVV